jgi:uncharacterized RDD family membrane protein YckC
MENSTFVVATPSLKRRLISMVYESLLLAAVEIFAVAVYTLLTLNTHSFLTSLGLNLVVILTAGAYFVHSWSGSGHTLAMKTWRIKVIKVGEVSVPKRVAIIRFVVALGSVMPALVIIHFTHLMTSSAGTRTAIGILLANIILWALTVFLDKDRQFLHDRVAGTRLIELPKRAKKAAAPVQDDIDEEAPTQGAA